MRYMKFLLCIAACMAFAGSAGAETPIDIVVNGKYIQMDSAPFLENDRTMVPIRFVSEGLDSTVTWDQDNGQVTIRDEETDIKIDVGKKAAAVNGETVYMDVAARLVNDRVYVPVRFVSEHQGAEVSWNQKACTVIINKAGAAIPDSAVDTSYTSDDLAWLSKIVHAEAQGESMEGKVAVANVVLNRVADERFPDTIYEVVFDRQYGVQFTPVANGAIYNLPSQDSVRAAKQALYGREEAGASLYYCNPRTSTSTWIINNRPFYKSIGNHDFYL